MPVSSTRFRRAVSSVLPAVFCFLIALLPRLIGLADFVTTDEAYHWVGRVEGFSFALSKGAWAETILTGHPGVPLMWLGSLGLVLERMAVAQAWTAEPSPIVYLAWLRFPSALLEALLIPLGYGLLRRLVAPTTAFIAALLWATSPFLIAHARLLHLDALLTSFVTLSILALLTGTKKREPRSEKWRYGSWLSLLASGICAGLALLTKGPALILLPAAGLLLFFLTDDQQTSRPATSALRRLVSFFLRRLGRVLPRYGLWLLTAALVVVALWPGLWVAPGRALTRYVEEISDNGGRPNGDGQFFLGRAVADPGPFFYPIVMGVSYDTGRNDRAVLVWWIVDCGLWIAHSLAAS